MTTDTIISKVWSFRTTLRDDGVGWSGFLSFRAVADSQPQTEATDHGQDVMVGTAGPPPTPPAHGTAPEEPEPAPTP
jgi:hypothetical protein